MPKTLLRATVQRPLHTRSMSIFSIDRLKSGGPSDAAVQSTNQPRPRADDLEFSAEPGYLETQLRTADLREAIDR